MDRFAELLVLALGRFTFGLLHYFEELGVDMSDVDVALAEWTTAYQELQAHNADLVAQLATANTTLTEWEALDAVEDAAQKAELESQIAAQIRSALETAQNPPTPPGEEVPPVETPPVDPGNPSQAPEGEGPQVNPL